MEFLSSRATIVRKGAERMVEKGFMNVSDAIYATGSAFEKGGSKVTSLLASTAGAVGELGGGIYDQACNLVGATKTSKVQEMLEAKEWVNLFVLGFRWLETSQQGGDTPNIFCIPSCDCGQQSIHYTCKYIWLNTL